MQHLSANKSLYIIMENARFGGISCAAPVAASALQHSLLKRTVQTKELLV